MKGRIRQLATGRFARDTVVTQAGLVAAALCSLVTAWFLWHGLGKAIYGRYALVFTLYGLVNLLGDLGLGKALVSRMGEARGARDEAAFTGHAAYLLKMTVIVGAAVTVVGVVVAPALSRLIYGKPEIGPYARLLCLASLVGVGRAFTSTLLAGMRRMKALAVFELSFAVVRLATIVGAIQVGLGLWGVIGAQVLTTLVLSVVGILYYIRLAATDAQLPPLARLAGEAVRVPWRATFKFGALVTVDRQLVKLIELVPLMVLGRVAATDIPAGYFNLARNIMRSLGLAFSGAAKNLLPFFSELKGKQQFERLRRNYRRAVLAGGLAAIVIAVVCVPLLPVALRLFRDGQHALTAVAYVLLAKFVVDGFSIGLGAFFITADKVWWTARTKLVSLPFGAALLIGATLVGRAWASDPAIGAALGAAAGYAAWWIALSLAQLAGSFRFLGDLVAREEDTPPHQPTPEEHP